MKTLIVIDMQNDFINGILGTKEAEKIVPVVKKKLDNYRLESNNIIFTRDTHNEQYLNSFEGKNLPIPHCVEGTIGWQITDELNVDELADTVINKPTFAWMGWYGFQFKDEIELCGLCTDICVVSNALVLRGMYPDLKITVDAKACAGTTTEAHKAALQVMKSCQINVINE